MVQAVFHPKSIQLSKMPIIMSHRRKIFQIPQEVFLLNLGRTNPRQWLLRTLTGLRRENAHQGTRSRFVLAILKPWVLEMRGIETGRDLEYMQRHLTAILRMQSK